MSKTTTISIQVGKSPSLGLFLVQLEKEFVIVKMRRIPAMMLDEAITIYNLSERELVMCTTGTPRSTEDQIKERAKQARWVEHAEMEKRGWLSERTPSGCFYAPYIPTIEQA